MSVIFMARVLVLWRYFGSDADQRLTHADGKTGHVIDHGAGDLGGDAVLAGSGEIVDHAERLAALDPATRRYRAMPIARDRCGRELRLPDLGTRQLADAVGQHPELAHDALHARLDQRDALLGPEAAAAGFQQDAGNALVYRGTVAVPRRRALHEIGEAS